MKIEDRSKVEKLLIDGVKLIFTSTRGKVTEVEAKEVVEIRYVYNPFGWMHANSWWIFTSKTDGGDPLVIWDYPYLTHSMRIWAKANLEGFDTQVFDQLLGNPCSAEEKDVTVWSKSPTAK